MGAYLGAGLLAVDHIYLSIDDKRRPRKYQYLGSSGGGTVSNVLCMLSLLENQTAIFGLTGNDLGERILKQDFRNFNINYEYIKSRGSRRDIRTTRQFTHKILQNGKHYFINECFNCGVKFTRDYQMTESDLTKGVLDELKTSHLIFDRANRVTYKLSEEIKKYDNEVIFDFGYNIFGKNQENNNKILGLCNVVKTNDYTIKKFLKTDDNVSNDFMEKYPNVDYLFVTNEDQGVYGYVKNYGEYREYTLPSIKNDYVKDSSGSGDIFLAVILNEISENRDLSFPVIIDIINLAQSLASLNCTMYGARALQLYFLKEHISGEGIHELGHSILKEGCISSPLDPYAGLSETISEPYRLSKLDSCKICGNLTNKRKQEIVKKNKPHLLRNLHKSLVQAPWTMMSSYNIGRNQREKIREKNLNGSIFIGSGGSLSASIYAETILLRSFNQLGKSMSPFELESFDNFNKNVPIWFISHGGNNADILGSALWASEYLYNPNGIVVLGNLKSKLADIARDNNWEIIHIPSKERNFVSVVGYLSQVAVLSGLLAHETDLELLDTFFSEKSILSIFKTANREMYGLAKEIAPNEKIIETLHLVGLARGWGWPALIDLESKIVEGGICTIEISELKNYTHGRYINTFGAYDRKTRVALMFSTPKDQEFISYLENKFGRYVKNKIIKTDNEGIIGSLELIIKSIFFAWHIGQIAKKNILKPKFPREARGLYAWEPEWRRNRWK